MSASAEVYISVDMGVKSRDKIESKIQKVLHDFGFDYNNKERYLVGRYQSGIIVEAKSHGCAWEIFEQEWADKLVRGIHRLDETADVELYVYNLDREADVVARTRSLFSENHKEKAHA
jgi:hypothetical protein